MKLPTNISLDCIPIKQGDFQLYGFSISAKKLWELVQINRKELDKDKGYQRALSSARRETIAKYIDLGNTIPNSVLIAFDPDKVTFDEKENVILIPDEKDIGWVIDGQHRLAGANAAEKDIELFVIAFLGINLDQQVQQFVTINREAKGVPTSLYLDLLKQLPPKKSHGDFAKERAAELNERFRVDPNSVFYNRIVYSGPRKGQMSLTNFVRKISPLVHPDTGKFRLYSFEEQYGILRNYFKALENVFPDEFDGRVMRFFSTLGFGAIINVLPTVFDLSNKFYKGFTVDDVGNVLKLISDFEFNKWDQIGTGSAAEISAGQDMLTELLARVEKTGEAGSLRL
jgi:DGQHR domain-containing protein